MLSALGKQHERFTVNGHTARIGLLKPGNATQKSTLAATGGAYHTESIMLFYGKGHGIKDIPVPECFFQTGYFNHEQTVFCTTNTIVQLLPMREPDMPAKRQAKV